MKRQVASIYSILQAVVSWAAKPCSPVGKYRCFEGTSCLHLQGWSILHTVALKMAACIPIVSIAQDRALFLYPSCWSEWPTKRPYNRANSSLYIFQTLRMEAVCSSETLIALYRTATWIIAKLKSQNLYFSLMLVNMKYESFIKLFYFGYCHVALHFYDTTFI
jgi:hypothetical protein